MSFKPGGASTAKPVATTRRALVRRTIAVSLVLLLIAAGLWWYTYSSIKPSQGETYDGKIRLTYSVQEAKHLRHKFRVRRVARHAIYSKPHTRAVGHCRTATANESAGHKLLMQVIEGWVEIHWCNRRSNDTQIARAHVTTTRADTCCLLNPWRYDGVSGTFSERYWDGNAYSEIARKVVYLHFTQHIGPLDLIKKTMYFDCRANALHLWFACHMGVGDTAPAWSPSW